MQFTLELLLTAEAAAKQFAPALTVLLYGLRTDLALSNAVERYREQRPRYWRSP